MKHWIGFVFLMTLMSVVTMGSSCRHLAEPTFPATNTFTPTSTSAITSTPSSTGTKTPTSTITGTPTPTITPGGPTYTPSSTPTKTSTSSPTSTPTITPTAGSGPCTVFLNDEAVIDNGTLNGNWDGYIYGVQESTVSTSAVTGVTRGSKSIDIDVTGSTASYHNVAILGSFLPTNWTTATSLVMDITGDPALISSCGSYCQLNLQGTVNGNDGSTLSASGPSITTATQTVTFALSGITAPAAVTRIIFIVNGSAIGHGHLYVDNIRLIYGGGVCPPPPSAAVTTWNFDTGTMQGWANSGASVAGVVATLLTGGYPTATSSDYFNLSTPFTGTYQAAMISQTFNPPLNITGGIRARVWVDASAATEPAGQIWPSDGTNTSYSNFVKTQTGAWSIVDDPVATFGSVNASAVSTIQVGASSGGHTVGTGNVQIDDIEVY